MSETDVVHLTEGSTLIAVSSNSQSWNIAGSSVTWRGNESPTGSETVARYQIDIMGTREAQLCFYIFQISLEIYSAVV
jgi:hypothetical protein